MKILELTGTKGSIIINLQHLIAIQELGDTCRLYLREGNNVDVKESFKTISNIIFEVVEESPCHIQ